MKKLPRADESPFAPPQIQVVSYLAHQHVLNPRWNDTANDPRHYRTMCGYHLSIYAKFPQPITIESSQPLKALCPKCAEKMAYFFERYAQQA